MECENKSKCNLESIVNVIGNRWNLFIIWHLRERKLRFSELQGRMRNVNSKTITTHLRDLERQGVIGRQVFPEVPPRVEYSLTDGGRALLPIIEAIREWGGAYLSPGVVEEDVAAKGMSPTPGE